MKRKNKLPKYYLGTRMPTSLGYQPNYGIGNQQFTSTPGQSIQPEITSLKSNIVPQAVNRAQQYGSNVYGMISNYAPMLNTAALKATTKTPQFAYMASQNPGIAMDWAAKQAGTKTMLNTAGKALGVIGAAYGLGDMGLQLYHNQDHRTAGDMKNTLTTNTYTTDYGNTYTTHGGLDRSAELNYAKAQRLNKNINFTTTAIGTGATIGSFFPGWGTAIGAGVGALVGLGANWLGFGDTEEETRKAINQLGDTTAMGDKMSYSLALDKDAKQGYYGRTNSNGVVGAAKGKRPVGYAKEKGNAMVSHGEVIGNLAEGWAYREPGIPDNNDTLKRHIKKSDFVISNKYGLSDYAANTGDYIGALQMQDMLMNQNKYYAKNGKLPKLSGGYWDYVMSAVPNIASMLGAYQQYNIDKHMPVEAPSRQTNYSAARNALYRMYGDQIDARPYLTAIDQDTARAIYGIQRMPGAGYGGRMLMLDSANKAALAQKAKQRLAIDEANRTQRNAAIQGLANLSQHEEDVNNENFWKTEGIRQMSQAAKYNALAQDLKNLVNPLAAGVKDYLSRKDYRDALGIKERMIKLYENQQDIDKAWIDNWLNKPEEAASSPGLKLTTPNLMQTYQNMINPRQQTYIPFTNIEYPQLTKPTLPYYNWSRYYQGMNPNNFVFNSNFR